MVVLIVATLLVAGVSCRAGKGCPTHGRSIGAERILTGDTKVMKAVKRAGKLSQQCNYVLPNIIYPYL